MTVSDRASLSSSNGQKQKKTKKGGSQFKDYPVWGLLFLEPATASVYFHPLKILSNARLMVFSNAFSYWLDNLISTFLSSIPLATFRLWAFMICSGV
ncbi:MAG: hypothetical protein IKK50_02750 [Ruminiclostridium sp.]|nr:hypothetical protein [Ruminiclostridium sp.]